MKQEDFKSLFEKLNRDLMGVQGELPLLTEVMERQTFLGNKLIELGHTCNKMIDNMKRFGETFEILSKELLTLRERIEKLEKKEKKS